MFTGKLYFQGVGSIFFDRGNLQLIGEGLYVDREGQNFDREGLSFHSKGFIEFVEPFYKETLYYLILFGTR